MKKRKNKWGYVVLIYADGRRAFEHRVKIARQLGRAIPHGYEVHHINGIKDDNRLCNLRLMTKRAHRALHRR